MDAKGFVVSPGGPRQSALREARDSAENAADAWTAR